MEQLFDVAVIGGGINGCGCAADAALRGLSVVLCEQDDIASQTSSRSTKMIHGGLRYLEYYDFAMVRKSLNERQILLNIAPHLVRPLPLFLPCNPHMRPSWLIRLGLFIYDKLSRKNTLPNSKHFRRVASSPYFDPLVDALQKGFLFYDCATEDARLTMANALQAKQHGAQVLTRTKVIHAAVQDKLWTLTLEDKTGKLVKLRARSIINATGPWVKSINQLLQTPNQYPMTLVKGSHLLVHRLYPGEHAYFLQHKDNRIAFVIPYQGYTMIGTTDMAFNGSFEDLSITSGEIDYLCEIVNEYFNIKIHHENIIHTWSGVRALLDSGSRNLKALSRDYAYFYSNHLGPVVSLYGGKITTYRQLAVNAVNELKAVFPELPNSLTHNIPLPGAELPTMRFHAYRNYVAEQYGWLDEELRERYLKNYGTRMETLLDGCHNLDDLGIYFGDTLYQIEVDYLIREEWAQTVEDILWIRTKLGLNKNPETMNALQNYLKTYVKSPIFS